MDNFYKRLGAELQKRCKAIKLSQTAVGEEMGVTPQQVSKYFLAQDRLPIDKFILLCKMLECKMCDVTRVAEG